MLILIFGPYECLSKVLSGSEEWNMDFENFGQNSNPLNDKVKKHVRILILKIPTLYDLVWRLKWMCRKTCPNEKIESEGS